MIRGSEGGSGGGGGGGGAFDLIQSVNNADAAVSASTTKNVTVVLLGIAAAHTLTMPAPAALHVGQRFTFVGGDMSLNSGNVWTIDGNGSTLNGLALFDIAASSINASPGGDIDPRGSVAFRVISIVDGVGTLDMVEA